MGLVEQEAISFATKFSNSRTQGLEVLKSTLTSQLYVFSRYRDQHLFLVTLRNAMRQDIENHKLKCRDPHCKHESTRDKGLFVVEQEIETVASFIEEPKPDDPFTGGEQAELYRNIQTILENLRSMESSTGAGMEVLFEELQDLKERLNYGKKTFWQLVRSKLTDAVTSQVIDKGLAQDIYQGLADGISNFGKTNLLP